MSADGYFRTPRRLLTANLSPERTVALLWIVSQASYTPRVVGGISLDVGETPPIPASQLEFRFKWTRKAARVFLEYALSERCAEETGIKLKIGQRYEGPAKGPGLGPAKGPTYIVRLHKVSMDEGPAKGPGLGPAKGPPTDYEKEEKKGINSPLRGESREGDSRTATAPRKRGTPTLLSDNWHPNDRHRVACDEASIDVDALEDDFRFYWESISGKKLDWDLTFTKRIAAVRSTGKFRRNGKHSAATGIVTEAAQDVAAAIVERMRG